MNEIHKVGRRRLRDTNVPVKPWFGKVKESAIARNILFGQRISLSLSNIDAPVGFSVCAVGSDGRLERGFSSLMEFRIYVRSEQDVWIGEIIENRCGERPDIFDREAKVEVVLTERDGGMFYLGNRSKPYPGRTFDSFLVFGDRNTRRDAIITIGQLLVGSDGKRILKKLSERKRAYKKVMDTGNQKWKDRQVTHYSIEEGWCRYSKKGEERAFKYGPLRFVQTVVERMICSELRRNAIERREGNNIEIAKNLPNPTTEKLTYLKDKLGKRVALDQETVDAIVDTYLFFLSIQHSAEQRSMGDEAETTVIPNIEETRDRIEFLNRVLNGQIIRE